MAAASTSSTRATIQSVLRVRLSMECRQNYPTILWGLPRLTEVRERASQTRRFEFCAQVNASADYIQFLCPVSKALLFHHDIMASQGDVHCRRSVADKGTVNFD